jgi:hypothetical protein
VTVTVPSGTSIGTTTLTLPTTGGTIQTSGSGYTTNGVAYASSTSALATGSALTWNGTTLTAINNSSPQTILLSRTSATARNWALGVDGDGAFRLTDTGSGGVVNLNCGAAGITTLNSASDLVFKANNTEYMRLTSAGNVGIGTNNPASILHVAGSSGKLYVDLGGNNYYQASNQIWQNYGGASEYMRLDSSGNLYIGYVGDPIADRRNGYALRNGNTFSIRQPSYTCSIGLSVSSGTNIAFYTDNGSSPVTAGAITSNGSTTAYGTSSDYRMKENIQPMQNALDAVLKLKPVTYTWKPEFAGTIPNGEGFVAHELAEVCPFAVIGEKDAVDKDGKPVYQGIDTSFLVATLTSAIQELSALVTAQSATITSLTERITALEGK